MYSILIRDEKDATKWSYALDENEAIWEGDNDAAKAKLMIKAEYSKPYIAFCLRHNFSSF